MKDIKIFEKELNLIKNKDIRELARDALELKVPDYVAYKWAASTGKYHPLGMDGSIETIADHTKKVVQIALHLLNCDVVNGGFSLEKGLDRENSFTQEDKDIIIAAAILHDTAKYGIYDKDMPKYCIFDHPLQVRHFYPYQGEENEIMIAYWNRIIALVESHEGCWQTSKYNPGVVRPLPSTQSAVVLHLADFIASRNNIHTYTEDSSRGLLARLGEALRGWWNEKIRYRSQRQAGKR